MVRTSTSKLLEDSTNAPSSIRFLTILALSGSVTLVQAYAQDADQGTGINIVEPPFQSPQQWTYDPADITVSQGATVAWTNTGAVAHTFTPGTFTYHCAFHPWMTGTLTIRS